jgi:hypothetical protein
MENDCSLLAFVAKRYVLLVCDMTFIGGGNGQH